MRELHKLFRGLENAPGIPHLNMEADGLELPCFLTLSLVPTTRPAVSGRFFLAGRRGKSV